MKKIGIVTDSNSGITQEEADRIGIRVVPMSFTLDKNEFMEGITIERERFFEKLSKGARVRIFQPSPRILMEIWDEMLEEYEQLIYIPMSGAFSSSVMPAKILAETYHGCVCVIDNHAISCTQKMAVLEAIKMTQMGFDVLQIRNVLERHKTNASMYIAIDDITYLKRYTTNPLRSNIASSILDVKPILQIHGDQLDLYAKARDEKTAHEELLFAIEQDMHKRFYGKKVYIKGAYSCDDTKAELWRREVEKKFPEYKVSLDPLALSIGCHVGEGAIAIVCMEELAEAPDIQYEICEYA